MTKTTYIAEVNEDGHIEYVWVSTPALRAPRPYNPRTDRFVPGAKASFSGAHPMAISSWLAAAQSFAGPRRS